ncbi:MAG: hypothetical protein HC830_10840 [Bacteroidetes bacterium]|nr:hypothetical protein [Bacteroidota bacterium]
MKSLKYITLMVLVLLTACDEAIERYPLDVPNAETFYKNEIEIQGGVNACYSFLVAGNNGYLTPEYSWDALADVVFIRGGGFCTKHADVGYRL